MALAMTTGRTDYGIFQIDTIHLGKTTGCPASSSDVMEVNTKCPVRVRRVQHPGPRGLGRVREPSRRV
jgi:hypothetical protein